MSEPASATRFYNPKIALITTTIDVPRVLKWYRACSDSVRFFVAADFKTAPDAQDFCANIEDCVYLSVEQQRDFGYKCSKLLGWDTITRRNIALLEALKWGADIIVTIDDDNMPLDGAYFDDFERLFFSSFGGIKASSVTDWFDVGALLFPPASHRGFPHNVTSSAWFDSTTDARIGVAAGICLGDPDISAVTRIADKPIVHGVSELLRAGIVVDNKCWTVFNSQNTAFIRSLAPCFLMIPQFSRYDDILASLVMQRVMRELDLHVHFGRPFVYQQRNEHDLLEDLKAEQWGAENIIEFSRWLDGFGFPSSADALKMLRIIHALAGTMETMPTGVAELGEAWCDDVESVL